MSNLRISRSAVILCLLIPACASTPKFDTSRVDKSATPARVLADPEGSRGTVIQWGGTIIAGENLKEGTRLEILAYPLDKEGQPDRDAKPLGRFLAVHAGYLEITDYAPGRLATVVGPVTGVQSGRIGQSQYTYVTVAIEQLYLWPRERNGRYDGSRVHFGLGVGIGL